MGEAYPVLGINRDTSKAQIYFSSGKNFLSNKLSMLLNVGLKEILELLATIYHFDLADNHYVFDIKKRCSVARL